jgi:hypothetical protein
VFNTLLGEIAGNCTNTERKMKRIQDRFYFFVKTLLENGKKEGIVGRNVDTHIHAHIIIASFTGMLLQWYIHEKSLDAVVYARAFRNAMLRSLGVCRLEMSVPRVG